MLSVYTLIERAMFFLKIKHERKKEILQIIRLERHMGCHSGNAFFECVNIVMCVSCVKSLNYRPNFLQLYSV